MKHGIRWVWIVAAALAGCGKEPSPEGAGAPRAAPSVPVSASEQATARLIEGMVSAVKADESPSIITVKFDLKARPEVGKPLPIALVFVPLSESPTLSATFVSESGLTVPGNQPPAEFSAVMPGAGYSYELKVVPEAPGVHYVSAVVQLQVDGVSRMQTYSVPVVVGPPPT